MNDLDSALNELGMLASSSNSREEYLTEIYSKKYLNMLTINTRYVSNVSIGFRVRPVTSQVRYKPYKMPKERHRTRSENNDSEAPVNSIAGDVDRSLDEVSQLKKAKSLESILAETKKSVEFSNINLGKTLELEAVSNSIQNLRVDE